ncbi:hypothetical protein AOLI_G00100080 [Acnodon oligacanthus]
MMIRIPLFLPPFYLNSQAVSLHSITAGLLFSLHLHLRLCEAALHPSSTEGPLVPHVSPFRLPLSCSLSGKCWGPGRLDREARGTIITWCHLRAPSKTPAPVIKRMKGARLFLYARDQGPRFVWTQGAVRGEHKRSRPK